MKWPSLAEKAEKAAAEKAAALEQAQICYPLRFYPGSGTVIQLHQAQQPMAQMQQQMAADGSRWQQMAQMQQQQIGPGGRPKAGEDGNWSCSGLGLNPGCNRVNWAVHTECYHCKGPKAGDCRVIAGRAQQWSCPGLQLHH